MYCLVLIGASNEVLMYKNKNEFSLHILRMYIEDQYDTYAKKIKNKRKQTFKVTKYAIQRKKIKYANNAL